MLQQDLSIALSDALPRVWRFAVRIARDADTAEQIVQRACECAIRDTHPPPAGMPFITRMFETVHALWLDHADNQPSSNDYRRASAAQLGSKDIVGAVDRLPQHQRIAMLLVHVEGLSCEEAAIVLRQHVQTVERHLYAARVTIGKQLRDRQEIPAQRS
ncbi:RNA polymerase sigma factor [Paraburkholderia sp. Tr-20389]|uniref:RNA polymerase sigma factor n=1 Tax=Paraburkholderia sp. Tr-20389 TaxID=2703903 RepID=UPI00197EBE5B|nr:RNA polymerase sigma factor [Paraburkholderia sp. Tr-20389]MBN3751548.1 RNA polymerase sigma factor [Paraburkholderia sp. Tr-20389]